VKVAEQRDGKTFQTLRPASQRNVFPHDSRAVRLQHGGIDTEGGCSGCCCEIKKRPPVNGKWSQSVRSLSLSDLAMSDVQEAAYRECDPRDT
jgi:hypothetical protein